MAGWTQHRGQAVALPLADIDTDQLIPARFMSAPRSDGYGRFLLHDLRRDGSGALRPDFPLNRNPQASVLVAGRNFGCGSSREAAVYALVDAGFRAVIAPGFGDIFASNAVNNGLLPARIDEADCTALWARLGDTAQHAVVDLNSRTIDVDDKVVTFDLDDGWCTKLINGWDDIDLTRTHAAEIRRYKDMRAETASWAWPAAVD